MNEGWVAHGEGERDRKSGIDAWHGWPFITRSDWLGRRQDAWSLP